MSLTGPPWNKPLPNAVLVPSYPAVPVLMRAPCSRPSDVRYKRRTTDERSVDSTCLSGVVLVPSSAAGTIIRRTALYGRLGRPSVGMLSTNSTQLALHAMSI